MIILADSSTLKTSWVMADGDRIMETAHTDGLNPNVFTRREISHIIRLNLPASFFKHRWQNVIFYGAGCEDADKRKIVEASLTAQFRSPVVVHENQLGAARGTLHSRAGVACILGTGTSCCRYDGSRITHRVRRLGHILGEEGSALYIGKRFVSDCLKGFASQDIVNEFFAHYGLDEDKLLREVNNVSRMTHTFAGYAYFLKEHNSLPYVKGLINDSMEELIHCIIKKVMEADDTVNFVGWFADMFSSPLREACERHGIKVGDICENPVRGLLQYHLDN